MSAQPSPEERNYGYWPADAGEASSVSPRQFLAFLGARGRLIAAVMALCLAGGLAFDLISTPRYVATTQLIIDPRGLQVVDNPVNGRGENADADLATVEDEMRVIKSTNLLSALIDKEDLTHNPEFARRSSPIVDALLSILPHGSTEPGDAKLPILQQLDQQIAVRRAERGYVIDIAVTTADARESARLANRLVQLYIERASQTRSDLAQRASLGLGNRLDELQARVRKADEKVEAYRTENNLVSAGGVLTSDQRLKDLNAQLGLAHTREDEARAKLDQINRLQASHAVDTIPEALDSQAVLHLRDQLTAVKRRLSTLKDQLGPRHPDYVSAANELQALDKLLAQELRRLAEATRLEYARAKDNEQAIERNVTALSQSSLSDSKSLVMLHELERDAEASRALFTAFLARSQELGEQTRLDTTNVRQISEAMPPLRKANPSHAVVLSVSLLLGLLLGSGLAILLGYTDTVRGGPPMRPRWQRP